MNLSRTGRRRLAGTMAWLGAGLAALAEPLAQTIPFSNNFDYASGTSLQSLTNAGWDASSALVQVQTNVVCVDTSSVVLPQNTALTNWVAPSAMTNVWTDLYAQMAAHDDTNDVAGATSGVLKLFMDRTGYIKVYDVLNGWLTLSNTVRGLAVPAYTNGQWGRITVFQNYTAGQCAIFLDGALIKERLPFVSNVTACSRFRLDGGNRASSYFDNFSMTRAVPSGLPDGQEIDAFGYLAITLNVGSGQPYTTIQSAITAALDRYFINVTDGTYPENVLINHALGGITGGVFVVDGTLSIAPGLAIASSVGFTSGNLDISGGSVLGVVGSIHAGNVVSGTGTVLEISGSITNRDMVLGSNSTTTVGQNLKGSNLTLNALASLSVTGAVSVLNIELGSNASFYAGGNVICQSLTERSAATGTISGTLTASGSLSLELNSVLAVGGAVTGSNLTMAAGSRLTAAAISVPETVTVADSATLVVNGQVASHDITVDGRLVLASGGGVTATNLTLGNSVTLAITNATVAVSNLSLTAGARLIVVNGIVTANGMVLSGSFTLDENWGNQGASSQLPYTENFEAYPAGTPMNVLGFRGWGASDSLVTVEQGRYVSASNGVTLGFCRTLSNRVHAVGASQVWTDFYVIPTFDANDDTTSVRSTAAFMAFVTTNGYLSLYNRTLPGWEVCTNDIWQNPVDKRQAGQWSRVSVLADYNTRLCAVFLDGVLLRQGFPFINPGLTSYSSFTLENTETNTSSLDNVYVGATYPATLDNDANGNGVPDALDILRTDDILRRGTIFMFR